MNDEQVLEKVWSIDADAPLQSVLDSPKCSPLLRRALTGALSWQTRNETPVRRALTSPRVPPQWVAALLALGATVTVERDDGPTEIPLETLLQRRVEGKVAALHTPPSPPCEGGRRGRSPAGAIHPLSSPPCEGGRRGRAPAGAVHPLPSPPREGRRRGRAPAGAIHPLSSPPREGGRQGSAPAGAVHQLPSPPCEGGRQGRSPAGAIHPLPSPPCEGERHIRPEGVLPPASGGPGGVRWGEARVARTPADEPIVAAVAVVETDGGVVRQARVALTGVWPEPVRLAKAPARLVGGPLDEEHIRAVAEAVEEEVAPTGDFLGSEQYRRAMAGVLTRRALEQCLLQEKENE